MFKIFIHHFRLCLKVVLAASALVAALTEPSWTGAEEGAHDDIYPGQSFDKNPAITIGSGSNDAVVFMEVKRKKDEEDEDK